MNRKQFLKTCGFGCLAGITGITLLQSCSSSHILSKEIKGSDILVPISDFEIKKKRETTYKKYIIIQNELLKSPICVYRFDATDYAAMLMVCTHQGAELQVFGDKLQCPAHGSEFNNRGVLENGPADKDLRKFPIIIENNILKISLK
jgi:Rieske Fe-S protein